MARSPLVGAVLIIGAAVELWLVHVVLDLRPQLGFLVDAATLIGLLELLGVAVNGNPLGILIDERNKMSLSRLQIAVWSVLILSAFGAIGLSRVDASVEDPLAVAIPEELLWILGITATALVGTPLIHRLQSEQPSARDAAGAAAITARIGTGQRMVGRLVTNTTATGAKWTDIFMGEGASTFDHIDVGKVQMFYFTAIAALVYAVSVFHDLGGESLPASLPAVSGGLAALLGLSNGAYLVNKAVPKAGG
jgi:hypothetical protein